MKIYLRLPGGAVFSWEIKPHIPMERERFYVLAGLAAFAMLLVTVLLYEVWR